VQGRVQETGERSSFQIGGYRCSRLAEMESVLRARIAAKPDLTLAELQQRLTQQGISIKIGALWHQLNKWNLTFKKTLHASEQERENTQTARRAWSEAQPVMGIKKLAFIDETWTLTSMTRRYRRAPRGRRRIASALHGHWETTAFMGGLRRNRLTAPMAADGSMDGELFLAWYGNFNVQRSGRETPSFSAISAVTRLQEVKETIAAAKTRDLQIIPMHREPLLLCLPKDHRLAAQEEIDLHDLRAERFILYERRLAPGYHDGLMNMFQRAGFMPIVAEEIDKMYIAPTLVAAGVGLAVLPQMVVSAHTHEVVLRRIRSNPISSQIGVAFRSRKLHRW
jgi:hypothetical protein